MRASLLLTLLASAACHEARASCVLPAGSSTRVLTVDGVERTYHLDVGPEARGPAPLVFLWHGFGSSGRQIRAVLDPARAWREAIVIAPEGLPRTIPELGPHSAPGWQFREGELGDRDLRFFDALLATLRESGCIDARRVYSTGFSNGAIFTHALACTRGDSLAAIAAVAGAGPAGSACDRPLPVLLLHGTADQVIPVAQGHDSFARWRAINGCAPNTPEGSGCTSARDCAAPLRLCVTADAHRWPARATAEIVSFFAAQARP